MHEDLIDFFQSNMTMKEHGFSFDDMENITPFERLVYERMLIQKLKTKAEQENGE